MLICLCKAVSDREIRQAIGRGACSMRSLCDKTGAGSCCGSCTSDLHALLKEARIHARSVAAPSHARQG